MKKRLKKSH
ncbi:hypothetical protein CGLO_11274 [Colletotrichum gloeosporioides Cg-14]|uniref:Uncharacterized protein n=1 Tax=Colletotrichum gloeosporioides (strain Cg-14) TaxID=1237896 RepID=T0KBH2_COLGC|nr:hypothetical protein CGLO_11274 [Colletotrichum gloeosporioides Cg-14]